MSERATGNREAPAAGSFGVPVGTVIVVVCFFLPWVTVGRSSAMTIASNADKAEIAFSYLGIRADKPLAVTRLLYVIPILALSTLMLDLVNPPGHKGRMAARLSMLAAGGTLCAFFAYHGYCFGLKLACGFWGSLTGALFLTTGVLFNVFRNE